MKRSKIFYLAETNLENGSAYSIHVIKMVSYLSKFSNETFLLIPNFNFKKFKSLKKKFLLKTNNFKIKSILNNNIHNFFQRLIFSFKSAFISEKNSLIITRSLWSSFFLIIFNKKHFLEVHHQLTGLTKFFFLKLNLINNINIIKIIIISKPLIKALGIKPKKILYLPDACDIQNFRYKVKIRKKIKNLLYAGSTLEGRGINLIINLAKKFSKLNFTIVGKKNSYLNNISLKNLKLTGFLPYGKIPSMLNKSDILLMPYEKNVFVNSKNLNTYKYMSPLKMFDYLAAGKIIMSSEVKVLKEVLKHKYNSILINSINIKEWEKYLKKIVSKKYNLELIAYNARKTAKIFSWENRVKKIINIYEKK
jgi:glycosyltransferase involved in cell wall biosynthesis